MNGSKVTLVALSAVALAGLSGIACAGVVNATFNGVGPAVSLNYTLVAPPGGGGTSAGLFNWTVNSNTGASLGPTFTGFCIELTQGVSAFGESQWMAVGTLTVADTATDAHAIAHGASRGAQTRQDRNALVLCFRHRTPPPSPNAKPS